MAIYSCSMYFNEADLWHLKVAEERDYVDHFIFLESKMTHSGKPKPLYSRKLGLHKFHDDLSIQFLKAQFHSDMRPWDREMAQRDAAMKLRFKDDDIIISCDMDEINRSEDMPKIIEKAEKHGFVRIRQHAHFYFINLRAHWWSLGLAFTGKFLRESGYSMSELRHRRPHNFKPPVVPTHGRHFSYLGDAEHIAKKIASFAHIECDRPQYTDLKAIQKRLDAGSHPYDKRDKEGEVGKYTLVPIDEHYPKTILNNLGYWKKYIKDYKWAVKEYEDSISHKSDQ